MYPLVPLAETPTARRWFRLADCIAHQGARLPWLRWLWYPLWQQCFRRGMRHNGAWNVAECGNVAERGEGGAG